MEYLKLFENYHESLFKKVDGDERHKYVTEKGYQDFHTSDISYLKKELWDDSLYNIIKEGPRSFEFWYMGNLLKLSGDYEFKIYKLSDEYFIVDIWFLPYGRTPQRKFLGHYLCDQIDGLNDFIKHVSELGL